MYTAGFDRSGEYLQSVIVASVFPEVGLRGDAATMADGGVFADLACY